MAAANKLISMSLLFILSMVLTAEKATPPLKQYYDVTFAESMGLSNRSHAGNNKKRKKWNRIFSLCEKLYEKNKFSQVEPKEQPIIPKIIHLIWVGPKMPPPVFKKCLEQIKKHLPDWECRIWTDTNVPELTLINQHYYDKETNYGAKADILRLELLNQFGGVYIDVDYLILQPLDILNHMYEFYIGLHPVSTDDILGNAVIGAVPGHPIIRNAIDTIKDHRNRRSVVWRTGPGHLQESFYNVVQQRMDERIIALPRSFLFPLDPEDKNLSFDDAAKFIKPESFGMHCWANSWWKQKRRPDGSYEFFEELNKALQGP